MNKTELVKGTTNFFVHSKGYIFKIERGQEVKLPIIERYNGQRRFPYVRIRGKRIAVLNLMLQAFYPETKAHQNLSFKVDKFGHIPLSSIKIKNFTSSWIDADDEVLMNNYKCTIKAHSANQRCVNQITGLQVYLSLKINEFKCIYCGTSLFENDWHLDHYNPLSKTGLNVFENIVPSCSICNLMKGSLIGGQFFKQVCRIQRNFKFKDERDKATTA